MPQESSAIQAAVRTAQEQASTAAQKLQLLQVLLPLSPGMLKTCAPGSLRPPSWDAAHCFCNRFIMAHSPG